MVANRAQLLSRYTNSTDAPTNTANFALMTHNMRRPRFSPLRDVPEMLRDSRLGVSLAIIKGTILSLTRFHLRGNIDSTVRDYVARQLTTWWTVAAIKNLTAIEFGWFPAEQLYRVTDGRIHFADFSMLPRYDTKPVTVAGDVVGVATTRAKTPYLAIPKSYWSVIGREHDPLFGRSRFYGAYDPWCELNSANGARDIRRLYFYKNAAGADVLRHPTGNIQSADGMTLRSCRDVAREALEHLRSGSGVTLPSEFDQHGNQLWALERYESSGVGGELMDYTDDLKKEMTEGAEIPPEVLDAAESGSGWSGRRVPHSAFQGLLTLVVSQLVADFDRQTIRNLLDVEFGITDPQYEIVPFGLVRDNDNNDSTITQPGAQIPEGAAASAQSSLVV